jgi:ethanolamine utilization protein EutQ (cupin superfamily)
MMMAMVELDDDLVESLRQLLDESNAGAVALGFEEWTLSHFIKDMIWDEMKRMQRVQTIDQLKRTLLR